MANYRRELRMGIDIRRKGKMEKATEFVERIKKVHARESKWQADRGKKKSGNIEDRRQSDTEYEIFDV